MIYILFIGLLAGAIAGLIVRGKGFGCLLNIIVGIAGAWIGSWLLPEIGINIYNDFWGNLLTAVIGAIVLLVLLRIIRKPVT